MYIFFNTRFSQEKYSIYLEKSKFILVVQSIKITKYCTNIVSNLQIGQFISNKLNKYQKKHKFLLYLLKLEIYNKKYFDKLFK